MVIVINGIKNRNTKCHILLNLSFFIVSVYAAEIPKIKGQTSTNANSSHFEEKSCEVNSSTLKITAKRVITPITAPTILERFVEVISKFLLKKSRTECLNEDKVINSIPFENLEITNLNIKY